MPNIIPFLWFNGNAEEAAKFYVSVFPNSEVTSISHNPVTGDVLGVAYTLDGVDFQGLNGGPEFPFTEAVSFFTAADTQEEIDHYWNALTSDGGKESMCGWLKDRFGVSWQVVPARLGELLADPDVQRSERVMKAMFSMSKIVIADLEAAAAG